MLRKSLIIASFGAMALSAPASATWWGSTSTSGGWSTSGTHTHTCSCGHQTCTSSTSGTTSTTSGTQVPEPGMLGLLGAGLIGLGALRLRRRKLA